MNKYYFTHGRGLYEFAKNELDILALSLKNESNFSYKVDVCDYIEGKLLFETNLDLKNLLKLTTIERLFFSIIFKKFDNCEISSKTILDNITESLDLNPSDKRFMFVLDNYNEKKDEILENNSKKFRNVIKYRIDCKLTGKWRSNSDLKTKIIDCITNNLSQHNFEVDLSSPNFVISCHLSEIALVLGIPVTNLPLSFRNTIKNIGLRSTICSAMIQLSEILENYDNILILDPFCGKSTILCEMMHQYKDRKNIFYLCSDCDSKQIDFSVDNCNAIKNSENLISDFICSNLFKNSKFPFKDDIFDLIITDLPFGKNHPVKFFQNQQDFYVTILSEFNRLVNKSKGFCVLLVNSKEMSILEHTLSQKENEWFLISKYLVSLGETSAYLTKISRSKS
ncbi:unnamed protein product [Brachionus calyciflorus]|uniref:Ribosomal RNA large subunit methyltransferase K/L-like methyltransferase domain-containing protein n=1 Tax=Brachionus calyciflorus TaxID=104777 RepID=A0A813YLV0_9BILA|nr:unnamed protein product [Brachionus calyciflorus]